MNMIVQFTRELKVEVIVLLSCRYCEIWAMKQQTYFRVRTCPGTDELSRNFSLSSRYAVK